MSGEKDIKRALIASLCEHPRAKEYRERAFAEGNIEGVMEKQVLTKADFFEPDDQGNFIIDTAGTWKNIDKILRLLKENGECLTHSDFLKPIGGRYNKERSLLDSAVEHQALKSVFTVDIWGDRFEEMENLWYRVPMPLRKSTFFNDGTIPLELKRQVFKEAGQEMPEDRLEKSGLSFADIREAFLKKEKFASVNQKLQQGGDYFRKEYVLMRDASGDTAFDNKAIAWNRYEALVKIFKEHGERFEVEDYIKQVQNGKNILRRAAEHGVLNKIFKASDWVGRLPDMLDLWSSVLEGWKTSPMTTRDFDNAYVEAESLMYIELFQKKEVTGKADLITPLNIPSEKEKAVLPLGLRTVWDEMEIIQDELSKRNEVLTISDLRLHTGQMDNSCIMCAAKFGHFDKVLSILEKSNDDISIDDFLLKDSHGSNLLQVLAEREQLGLAFSSKIWAGRLNEMKKLWSHVSVSQRGQLDILEAEVKVKQATLKKKKTGGIKGRKKGPGKK